MPSKNTVKNFDTDAMYHVYNRGVERRSIFLDERDYAVFLSFLKYALLSNAERSANDAVDPSLISDAVQFNLRRLGLEGRLDLVSYCLMPNHFHLLFYQHDKDAITALMRSVATGYVMYFNRRYEREGRLFQGTYKAVHVDTEAYWTHISRYVHLNPIDIGRDFKTYEYSSYKYYEDKADADWVKPLMGMSGMDSERYRKFCEEWIPYRQQLAEIKKFVADS